MNGIDDERTPAQTLEKMTPPGASRVYRRRFVIRPGLALRMRLERILASFRHCLERDLDAGHAAPWVVLAFAGGVWIYFSLPREPLIWATVPLAMIISGIAWTRWSRGYSARLGIVLAAIAAGLAGADLRAALVEAPRLSRSGGYDVTGQVMAFESRRQGYRLKVRPTSMSRVEADVLPRMIRVTARSPKVPPEPGSSVAFRARLSPPGGPVMPGGYAFDVAAYFSGIGANGFVLGTIQTTDTRPPGVRLWAKSTLAAVRAGISARIRSSLDGDAGGIAAALIVGNRGGVGEEVQEDLRVAGLAHVLAISGMHMALVSGTIFFALRAGLACFSGLALNYPIRQWAAAAALAAATVYLFLSGASVATQRAYMMAAIVFIAILAGRRAVTMRSVAVAALTILILSPEALLQPGFQMSFAAVIALVATYEAWSEHRRVASIRQDAGGSLRLMRFWVGGLLMTSLIAGLATAPIAAAHFYRVAPLGLLANMAAMPLVSLVIMPMGVLSVLAMPFGLEPIPLAAMGWGIDSMLSVAASVSDMTPSGGLIGAISKGAALACICGLFLLAFLKSRWRLIGIGPIVAGVLAAPAVSPPDILISEDGRTVAARQADGRLAILQGRGGRFSAEVWLRSDGDAATVRDRKGGAPALHCDDLGCVLRLAVVEGDVGATPPSIAVLRSPSALGEDCRRADIVVASFPAVCAGGAEVFDVVRLGEFGAVALYLDNERTSFRTVNGTAAPPGQSSSGQSSSLTPVPQSSPKSRLQIVSIETARAGRHRPWHGVPAD